MDILLTLMMKDTRSDEMLVEEVRRRQDREALGELIERYDRPIFAFLLKMLRDAEKAEDCAQETFLRMLRGLDGYRSEFPFRPWLYGIAVNAARRSSGREADRSRRERLAALSLGKEDASGSPADRMFRKEVASLVDELPEVQREAVLLHYFQGLSHSEVASTLEVPAGTVATRIHGGLEYLRGRLATLGLAAAVGALEGLLAPSAAEAAPSSIRTLVLRELSGNTWGRLGPKAVLKGVVMSKLSSVVALGILCTTGGAIMGYVARSAHERQEPLPATASRPVSPPEAESAAGTKGAAVPPRFQAPVVEAPARVPTPPGPKKTKLQRAAALMARSLQASGKNPRGELRLSPEDSAEFMSLAADPEFLRVMEKAGELDWGHSGEFLTALLEELVPDLSDPQKLRLQAMFAKFKEQAEVPLPEGGASGIDRKLLEVRQGRELFQVLHSTLNPSQSAALAPLERLGVHSATAQIVRADSPDATTSGVLDLWSKRLAPLNEEERTRLTGAAGQYAARIRVLQAELEATNGAGFLKSLSVTSALRLVAGPSPDPASDPPAPQNPGVAALSGSIDRQFDAIVRFLELERDQRQSLAALLPSQAQVIRKADAYIPILESGPPPGFLGISGSDAAGGGVLLTRIVEESPAKGVGLQAGDLILEVNGIPVPNYSTLVAGIREAGAGAELELKVRRSGTEFSQRIRLSSPK